MSARNAKTLIAGVALIALGALFLIVNLTTFQIDWLVVLKTVLPVLFILGGVLKLARHFGWPEEEILRRPAKPSLLAGLFWTSLGAVLLADIFGLLDFFPVIGLYWPLILIAYGLGKIFDYYRFKGALHIRPAEIFGVIFIIAFGLTSSLAAHANWRLLGDWGDWSDITVNVPFEVEKPKFEFPATETVSIGGARRILIQNLYGRVRVEPAQGRQATIRLSKVIRSETREKAEPLAEEVRIISTLEDETLSIGTNRVELGENGKNVTTDLAIEVPSDLPVAIENGYGDVFVVDRHAACEVTNSFGDVRVERIEGSVGVTNRNRSVDIREVKGAVEVKNQRGAVRLAQITGKVVAQTDYDLVSADTIQGSLDVGNHFGSVRLTEVSGPVSVDAIGSQVTVTHLGQGLTVKNSHKNVKIEDIDGRVNVETSYARVTLQRIRGPIDLKAVHAEVTAKEIEQGLDLQGRGSKVDVSRARGALEIETSLRPVKISSFSGPVTVQNEYEGVTINSEAHLTGPIKVSNRNGNITLVVPGSASFDLLAQSVGGSVDSDFGPPPKAEGARDSASFVESKIGSGGPTVELQTTYSRIRIEKRG